VRRLLSEEKIQKIMKDTTSGKGGFLDMGETDGGECGHAGVLSHSSRFVLTHV
jgi:hypothetical protein